MGADELPSMLETARRMRLQEHGPEAGFVACVLDHLPVHDGEVPGLACRVSYCVDRRRLLRLLARVTNSLLFLFADEIMTIAGEPAWTECSQGQHQALGIFSQL